MRQSVPRIHFCVSASFQTGAHVPGTHCRGGSQAARPRLDGGGSNCGHSRSHRWAGAWPRRALTLR